MKTPTGIGAPMSDSQAGPAAGQEEPNPLSGPGREGLPRLILWRGGRARIWVERSFVHRMTSVVVDGEVVARMAKPSLQNPWVECQIPGSDRPITVVQMQPRRYWYKTVVFVDGVSIEDGFTLDAWRAHKPIPMDLFEQRFRGFLWGPLGALIVGAACSLPQLFGLTRTGDIVWAIGAAVGFLIGSGWMLVVFGLVRWLRTKRSWSWRGRSLLVGFVLLGIPVLVVAIIQSLTR